jgi:hypothetical protein
MLNLHESAATACGLEGCLSRGHAPISNCRTVDSTAAVEAITFLREKGLVR